MEVQIGQQKRHRGPHTHTHTTRTDTTEVSRFCWPVNRKPVVASLHHSHKATRKKNLWSLDSRNTGAAHKRQHLLNAAVPRAFPFRARLYYFWVSSSSLDSCVVCTGEARRCEYSKQRVNEATKKCAPYQLGNLAPILSILHDSVLKLS